MRPREALPACSPHPTFSAYPSFSPLSPQIGWLLHTLSELSPTDRRLFLRFCTGAARLPLGGWAALSPPLTVVRAVPPPGVAADLLLPTCSTCQVRVIYHIT